MGQLGLGDTNDRTRPERVPLDSPLLQVQQTAAGDVHSAFVSTQGDVYTWGSGHYGQLGIGSRENKTSPVLVSSLQGKRITKISCGSFHTLALTELSNVFSWGRGAHGRLGHGNEDDLTVPKLMESFLSRKTKDISGGHRHTAAVTMDGAVYCWGDNSDRRLGVVEPNEKGALAVLSPLRVVTPVKFNSVCCGDGFTLACSEQNIPYSWGVSDDLLGLGYSEASGVQELPRLIDVASESNALPSLSEWSQVVLEKCLISLHRRYRLTDILRRAFDIDNSNAAATIYLLEVHFANPRTTGLMHWNASFRPALPPQSYLSF
jgi:alpha-tubulin suppressor-like RCC1 family protein